MAKLVKLQCVRVFNKPENDKDIYVNPDYVQTIVGDVMKISEITMNGNIIRVRGELDEIAEKLSSTYNRRFY